eukprot:scaffold1171_cov177-Amphora_coffeaeformis.AAC.9
MTTINDDVIPQRTQLLVFVELAPPFNRPESQHFMSLFLAIRQLAWTRALVVSAVLNFWIFI